MKKILVTTVFVTFMCLFVGCANNRKLQVQEEKMPIESYDSDYKHIIFYGQSLSIGVDSKHIQDDIEDDCFF